MPLHKMKLPKHVRKAIRRGIKITLADGYRLIAVAIGEVARLYEFPPGDDCRPIYQGELRPDEIVRLSRRYDQVLKHNFA